MGLQNVFHPNFSMSSLHIQVLLQVNQSIFFAEKLAVVTLPLYGSAMAAKGLEFINLSLFVKGVFIPVMTLPLAMLLIVPLFLSIKLNFAL
jgi:hypothetical protein